MTRSVCHRSDIAVVARLSGVAGLAAVPDASKLAGKCPDLPRQEQLVTLSAVEADALALSGRTRDLCSIHFRGTIANKIEMGRDREGPVTLRRGTLRGWERRQGSE